MLIEEDKAEETVQDESSDDTSVINVADMSVSTIILALHTNALSKCGADAANVKLINSAVDEKGTKIESAGEHIVSVLPLNKGEKVKKTDAVKVLKTYVQWFVGPDLADKVTDSTILSLNDSPDAPKDEKKDEKTPEGDEEKLPNGWKDPTKDDEEKLIKESKAFMSFRQFLLEADESSDEEKLPDGWKDPTKDDEEGEKKEEDGGKNEEESDLGYYIPYKLDVKGLPQEKLDGSIKKFLKNSFLKFLGGMEFSYGAFGGSGGSFTGKDVMNKVKTSWKSMFAKMDKKDLQKQLQIALKKIGLKNVSISDVKTQSSKSTINKFSEYLNGQQKKDIQADEYCAEIFVTNAVDKEKANVRKIADAASLAIQKTSKGFFTKDEKFKANDIIFIKDYERTEKDLAGASKRGKFEKKLRRLKLPVVLSVIKNNTLIAAYRNFKKVSAEIESSKYFDDYPDAKKFVKAWDKFNKSIDDISKNKDKDSNDQAVKDKFFKPFVDNLPKKSSLDEMDNSLKLIQNTDRFKQLVIESLLENFNLDEAEEPSDELTLPTSKEIKEKLKSSFSDAILNAVKVGKIDSIVSKSNSDMVKSKTPDGFEYGIKVTFKYGELNEDETEYESELKNEIFDILFESAFSLYEADGTSKLTADDIKKAFTEALMKELKIAEIADPIEIKLSSKSGNSNGFVVPFKPMTEEKSDETPTDDGKSKSDDASSADNTSDGNDNADGDDEESYRNDKLCDVYIVPFKNLKNPKKDKKDKSDMSDYDDDDSDDSDFE